MQTVNLFLKHPSIDRLFFVSKDLKKKPIFSTPKNKFNKISELAILLASNHSSSSFNKFFKLKKYSVDNATMLDDIYVLLHSLVASNDKNQIISDYYVDNYYLIERQLKIVRSLSSKEYKSLEGNEFLYQTVSGFIQEHSGSYELEDLNNYLTAYQDVRWLNFEELKHLQLMIVLSTIDHIACLISSVAIDKILEIHAIYWSKNICSSKLVKNDFYQFIGNIDDIDEKISFFLKLRDVMSEDDCDSKWLIESVDSFLRIHLKKFDERIGFGDNNKDKTFENLKNSIDLLRHIATWDWMACIETNSEVSKVLSTEKMGVYPLMDLQSKFYYLTKISELAKKSCTNERVVIDRILELASKEPNYHIGHYLIGSGLDDLYRSLGSRPKGIRDFVAELDSESKSIFYILANLFLSIVITLVFYNTDNIIRGWLQFILYLLIFSISIHLSTSLINIILTRFSSPSFLPRLDFENNLPQTARTLIVVPCFLFDQRQCDQLLLDLELRYLSNSDENLHFGLVTDFIDSDYEINDKEQNLLEYLSDKILSLNTKYKSNKGSLFYLFHRKRVWNSSENIWMGYERKRGKLLQLCVLLREGGDDKFLKIVGDASIFSGIKYLITLDVDTKLPKDSAKKLIGIMAHPLNVPKYCEEKGRVVEGYGILQPITNGYFTLSDQTGYSQIFGNSNGIDQYTQFTSDFYQDSFSEGSFVGKGIIDIETFYNIFKGKFPENRILSHDLLEGAYMRSGVVSDITFFEDYPSTYLADVNRKHRWIRGDWQIAIWLLRSVPGKLGYVKNSISLIYKWKIFDNLRRSLLPFSYLFFLTLCWGLGKYYQPLIVIGIAIFLPFCNVIISLFIRSFSKLRYVFNKRAFSNEKKVFIQCLIFFINLPFEAYYQIDAIIRVFYRLKISKRKILEWKSGNNSTLGWGGLGVHILVNFLFVILISIFLYFDKDAPFYLILCVVGTWIIAPFFMEYIGRQKVKIKAAVDIELFRAQGLRNWLFFQKYVNENQNWLPPDNVQEFPFAKVSTKTSPTNIGLSLLANLTAFDLGFLTVRECIIRTKKTLETITKMEKFKGHLFNWYDINSLRVVGTRYISTVDSGNFLGDIYTLKAGLEELKSKPVIDINNILYFHYIFLEIEYEGCLNSEDFKKIGCIIKNYIHHEKFTPHSLKLFLTEIKHLLKNILKTHHNNIFLLETFQEHLDLLERELEIYFSGDFNNNEDIENQHGTLHFIDLKEWQEKNHFSTQNSLIEDCQYCIDCCHSLLDVEFEFLFDRSQKLLSIGYDVTKERMDAARYDLLISESRLAYYIAISQNKIPVKSWFSLGRPSSYRKGQFLLSWSGSMFEYLMPALVMPTFANSLLDETTKYAIREQIHFGIDNDIPWGVSECSMNVFDSYFNYLYGPIGVPNLSIQKIETDRKVVAPYATILAAIVEPELALQNVQRLYEIGVNGKFGFYESIDYSSVNLKPNQNYQIVFSYMAHHVGMSLIAIGNILRENIMQKRFNKNLELQANSFLLQEHTILNPDRKLNQNVPLRNSILSDIVLEDKTIFEEISFTGIRSLIPYVHVMSNGTMQVMINESGGGFAKWKDLAINRWQSNILDDKGGAFIYIKELSENRVWSPTFQPLRKDAHRYSCSISNGIIKFRRQDLELPSCLEVFVCEGYNVEIRRLTIRNNSKVTKKLTITSYSEIVLTSSIEDILDRSHSNLFVESEIIEQKMAIICHRRASTYPATPHYYHSLVSERTPESVLFNTDRLNFIGRGRSLENPIAIYEHSNGCGAKRNSLDSIVSIESVYELSADEELVICYINGIEADRNSLLETIEDIGNMTFINSQIELSKIKHNEWLKTNKIHLNELILYNYIVSSLFYANPNFYNSQKTFIDINISPIITEIIDYGKVIVLQISDGYNFKDISRLIRSVFFASSKQIEVTLIIISRLDPDQSRYIRNYISTESALLNQSFVATDKRIIFFEDGELEVKDELYLKLFADIYFNSLSSFSSQLAVELDFDEFQFRENVKDYSASKQDYEDLCFFNDFGGFNKDGCEYVIVNRPTPMPWTNILANKNFGTIMSENGHMYTWAYNAKEFKISPPANDGIINQPSEIYYIKDNITKDFWILSEGGCTVCKHGFGYTVFEQEYNEIFSSMNVHVAVEDNIKICKIELENRASVVKDITICGYVEFLLDTMISRKSRRLLMEWDETNGALLVSNKQHKDYHDVVCYYKVLGTVSSFTTSKLEFLGQNGSIYKPRGLFVNEFSCKNGSSEPCAAITTSLKLNPGDRKTVHFILGCAEDKNETIKILRKYSDLTEVKLSLADCLNFWSEKLGKIKIFTPKQEINFLINGWLSYQVISSRLFARNGPYQPKGAYVFRDQLQDIFSILQFDEMLARDVILEFAKKMFKEGDALQWWDNRTQFGYRTKMSDDHLWLPHAVAEYVTFTGDRTILDETVSCLTGDKLDKNENGFYGKFIPTDHRDSLLTHCFKAIIRGLELGENGLAKIRLGDWNLGMDKVGEKDKGESVWLSFFLYKVIVKFRGLLDRNHHKEWILFLENNAKLLKDNIDANCRKDAWYCRAMFDNGSILGSASSLAFNIDIATQSLSVLSEAGDPEFSMIAIHLAYSKLLETSHKTLSVFQPPFEKSKNYVGTLSCYPEGVKENGAQQNEAAAWMGMAFAKLGNQEKSEEIIDLINPIHRSLTKSESIKYKLEPYVIANDIVTSKDDHGRGGWSWYTSAANWTYKFILEYIVGIKRVGNCLELNPLFFNSWSHIEISYSYGTSAYDIILQRTSGENHKTRLFINDVLVAGNRIILIDDGCKNRIKYEVEVNCELSEVDLSGKMTFF